LIEILLKRKTGKDLIRAGKVVERESQKGIIIGRRKAAIKRLGETARFDI